MDFQKMDMAELISRITREVVSRIEYANKEDEAVKGTVALFTAFVPAKIACSEALKEHFGMGIDCALFNGVKFSAPGCFPVPVNCQEDEDDLLQRIAGAKEIVLVAPKLELLYRLAEGNDAGFIEQCFLRPLLWGRKVSILLDFAPPTFKRATFFERVVDALDVLERMGVAVYGYKPTKEDKQLVRKTLVTEQDVLAAAESGEKRILCEINCIVTPLAKETADTLGVSIDY